MKKKTLYIIMCICILDILLLSTCLIMLNHGSHKKDAEISKMDKKMASEYIDKLLSINYFVWHSNSLNEIKEYGFSDEVKLRLAIEFTENNEEIYTCEDAFPYDTFMTYDYRPSESSMFSCRHNDYKRWSYKYDDVLASYRKLFGSIGNPKKGFTPFYDYSQKLNVYIQLEPNFGSGVIVKTYNKYEINSIETKNGMTMVDITYLSYDVYSCFGNEECEEGQHWQNFAYNTSYGIEKDAFGVKFEIDKLEEIFNSERDKLPHLLFTFINEDGTYYLIDVK